MFTEAAEMSKGAPITTWAYQMLRCYILALFLPLILAACEKTPLVPLSPLSQRAYVWQREWTPAVASAVRQATPPLDSLVIFGAEIYWQEGRAKALLTNVDWETLRRQQRPISIAMRVASQSAPFAENETAIRKIASTAAMLLEKTRAEKVECTEFQLDFDCAQKKLLDYARWLPAIRTAVTPTRLVITTLPSWLDEPAFPALLDHTDGYVLQVHSISVTQAKARNLICDPPLARAWVAKAVTLGRPFEVALSTYSGLAGYDAEGKLLGLALDGVQPAWPGGTKIMTFESDAAQIAALVQEWQTQRPEGMRGVLWYRLPVSTDMRNWRWPTFAAVIAGRTPESHLTVTTVGSNPIDIALLNDGEAGEVLTTPFQIVLTWPKDMALPTAFEALPDWTAAAGTSSPSIIFTPSSTQRLSPSDQRGIGWVRFNNNPSALAHAQIIR